MLIQLKRTLINMFNSKVFIGAIFVAITTSIQPLTAKVRILDEVKDLNQLSQVIKKDNPTQAQTLVIFDIDDTLLESANFVGSGKWYNWQREREVFDKNGQQVSIKKEQQFYCMFRTLGTLFEIGSTHLTQNDAVDVFNQHKKYDLMILTARTAKYRAATERELNKHNIHLENKHFKSVIKGLDYTFNDEKRTARVTYKKGIAMASGLNKGMVLADILKKAQKNYQHIYFIDDSKKNIKNLAAEWKNKPSKLTLLHYIGVDKTITPDEIEQSDNAKKYFDLFLKNAFHDQFKAFKNTQCD